MKKQAKIYIRGTFLVCTIEDWERYFPMDRIGPISFAQARISGDDVPGKTHVFWELDGTRAGVNVDDDEADRFRQQLAEYDLEG